MNPIEFFEKLQYSVNIFQSFCLEKIQTELIFHSPLSGFQIIGRLDDFPDYEENESILIDSQQFELNHSLYQNDFTLKELFKISSNAPKSQDIGKFKIIRGMVVKMSTVKVYTCQHSYICCKCNFITVVKSNNIINLKNQKPPLFCSSNIDGGCNSTKFSLLTSNLNNNKNLKNNYSDLFVDYQEIKIQEQNYDNENTNRVIPRSFYAIVQHDQVDICQPGDIVILYGVIVPRYKSVVIGVN